MNVRRLCQCALNDFSILYKTCTGFYRIVVLFYALYLIYCVPFAHRTLQQKQQQNSSLLCDTLMNQKRAQVPTFLSRLCASLAFLRRRCLLTMKCADCEISSDAEEEEGGIIDLTLEAANPGEALRGQTQEEQPASV